ncbi:MAG: DnaJ domain-containing protein [Rickettsiales bacterium]|jgi:hypothetical protein|nr:DnaJ domain-containing protein [Rickettsiales bacterium]
MIGKCDHPGCDKAGTCRAPKSRELNAYWHFCRAHAAEYNKNWNYYRNMTAAEIEIEWESETFGEKLKADPAAAHAFITGRMPAQKSMPPAVADAYKVLELPATATLAAARAAYRRLAKLHHPDAGGDADKFTKITAAFGTVKTFLEKKALVL